MTSTRQTAGGERIARRHATDVRTHRFARPLTDGIPCQKLELSSVVRGKGGGKCLEIETRAVDFDRGLGLGLALASTQRRLQSLNTGGTPESRWFGATALRACARVLDVAVENISLDIWASRAGQIAPLAKDADARVRRSTTFAEIARGRRSARRNQARAGSSPVNDRRCRWRRRGRTTACSQLGRLDFDKTSEARVRRARASGHQARMPAIEA
jgi:hypothetical protein